MIIRRTNSYAVIFAVVTGVRGTPHQVQVLALYVAETQTARRRGRSSGSRGGGRGDSGGDRSLPILGFLFTMLLVEGIFHISFPLIFIRAPHGFYNEELM